MSSIILLLLLVIVFMATCHKASGDAKPVYLDSSIRWQSRDSTFITSIYKIRAEQMQAINKFWIDSIGKLHDIAGNREKKIKQLTVALTEANSEIPAEGNTIYITDTVAGNCPPVIKSMINNYQNKWYNITARTGEGAYVKVRATDTLRHMVSDTSIGNLFNRRFLRRTDISFSNPYVEVMGMKTFMVPDYNYSLSLQATADAFYLDKDIYGKAGLYILQERGILKYGGGGGVWMNGSGRNGYYVELTTGLKFTLRKR